MSTQNMMSVEIPAEVVSQVTTKFSEIRTLLKPYLVAVSPEQRRQLPKMGDKSISFVGKTLDYIQSNPEFAPPFLDLAELKKDLNAAIILDDLQQLSDPLTSDICDTELVCGSEAYVAALTYYNTVKQAAKMNHPSAKAIFEDLKKRFDGQGGVVKKEPSLN